MNETDHSVIYDNARCVIAHQCVIVCNEFLQTYRVFLIRRYTYTSRSIFRFYG